MNNIDHFFEYLKIIKETPPAYVWTVAGELSVFLPIAIILYFRKYLLDIIQSRTLWALLSVGICSWFTCGGMWVYINKPRIYGQTKQGIKIISNDYWTQYTYEMYAIGLLNIGITISLIMLIEAAGGVNTKNICVQKPKSYKVKLIRNIKVILGVIITCFSFSLMIQCYQLKEFYPFRKCMKSRNCIQFLGNVYNSEAR